jgi:hypothetical protein
VIPILLELRVSEEAKTNYKQEKHHETKNTDKNNGPVVRQDAPEMLPSDVMFYFLWFWRCFCFFFHLLVSCHFMFVFLKF